MIQDIFPTCFDNHYEKKEPKAGDRMLIFRENEIFVKKGEALVFPAYEVLEGWCRQAGAAMPEMVYLFSLKNCMEDGEKAGTDYFLTELPREVQELSGKLTARIERTTDVKNHSLPEEETKEDHQPSPEEEPWKECQPSPEAYEYVRMFAVRAKKPKEQVLAAATAWHLYVWYRDNRYCGRCGKRLVHSGKLRMLSCPDCGNQVFPKIAPAVIVGVTDGERILMTKYANREYKRYALIAGFTEIGETAEETVRREVMEEVGLSVKNIRYYKSQPWGFDSNLLLGYFCELDDAGDIRLDEEELATAEWVHYRDIPEDAEGLSLTREMMTVFRDGLSKRNHIS